MNCLPNISIALTLIALIAGVWFLHKTQKENLSILYKIAAWFVIIVATLNMACCGMRCMRHGGGYEREERRHHGEWGGKERHGMRGGDYYNIRAENCWMGDKDCKTECDEAECDDNGKCSDNEKDGECKMKKDTTVLIKKVK